LATSLKSEIVVEGFLLQVVRVTFLNQVVKTIMITIQKIRRAVERKRMKMKGKKGKHKIH
jgi:hypothetical protein